jgi:hypothetical protein
VIHLREDREVDDSQRAVVRVPPLDYAGRARGKQSRAFPAVDDAAAVVAVTASETRSTIVGE